MLFESQFHAFGIFLLFQYNKHLFVHIGQTNHSYSDALLESVDIRQIYDKFPEKKGGLKELYGKGPQNSFFLIKFWVSAISKPKHTFLNVLYVSLSTMVTFDTCGVLFRNSVRVCV